MSLSALTSFRPFLNQALGPIGGPIAMWVGETAQETLVPEITAFLKDPSAVVSRIGDVMVWNGASGQSVMMGLQALNESQARIGLAVESIEKAQIVTNAALGSLQSLSMAALGISTLTGGMMLWRLNALNNRVSKLAETMIDVLNAVTAANHAHLNFAIQKLKEFDEKEDEALASRARDEAQFASSIYARLAVGESQKKKLELAAMNCASRYYLLSLLSEFQARLLLGDAEGTVSRYNNEKKTIEVIAKATFEAGIAETPQVFLSEDMRRHNITLDLMTEVYQHAHRLSAITEPRIYSASEMFEYVRDRGIEGKTMMRWPFGVAPDVYANRMKYTMACFEDIGRVEALSIHAQQAMKRGLNLRSIQQQVEEMRQDELNKAGSTGSSTSDQVFGYAM